MPEAVKIDDSTRHNIATLFAYVAVAICIVLGWHYSDRHIIQAEDGLGYALGIVGTTLMGLLLLYPLRKRAQFLRNAGPVRYWFKTHMIFGVLGPLLIIFHSNFELGSLNSRVALFCTIVVASSGIVGRYLYAQLHYGLYGKRASLVSLRKDLSNIRGSTRDNGVSISKLIPAINEELQSWEDHILNQQHGFVGSVWAAFTIAFSSRIKYRRLKRRAKSLIYSASASSPVLEAHKDRLEENTRAYLKRRITLLRKFAQHNAFERLFSLWHIVHYPLFILLVVAAILHIVAVHMY